MNCFGIGQFQLKTIWTESSRICEKKNALVRKTEFSSAVYNEKAFQHCSVYVPKSKIWWLHPRNLNGKASDFNKKIATLYVLVFKTWTLWKDITKPTLSFSHLKMSTVIGWLRVSLLTRFSRYGAGKRSLMAAVTAELEYNLKLTSLKSLLFGHDMLLHSDNGSYRLLSLIACSWFIPAYKLVSRVHLSHDAIHCLTLQVPRFLSCLLQALLYSINAQIVTSCKLRSLWSDSLGYF